MKELSVSRKILYEMMYQTISKSAMVIPKDIKNRMKEAIAEETSELAKANLETTLKSFQLAEENQALLCGDTGWPLFYIKCGDNVRIEGGFSTLFEIADQTVDAATKEGRLRENMVHPWTRKFSGNNVGFSIPMVEIQFDSGVDYLEVIGISKGGGAECFGSSFKALDSSDGRKGVWKFIMDNIKESTYAGKTCPPNIIGIGLGGTADLCLRLAKQAALLRPMGDRHPDPEIAQLERDVINFVKALNRGPAGTGGLTGMLDVHIECAACNQGMCPVGIQMQCSAARRAVARYTPGGGIEYPDVPTWFRQRR